MYYVARCTLFDGVNLWFYLLIHVRREILNYFEVIFGDGVNEIIGL